jgi:hypothetical protein
VPAENSVSSFQTEREAKEFLIARILAEANREGVKLSEVERKMLYFTETGWSLPGIMDVNAEFERDYDNDEYEPKIADLVRSIETKNSEAGGDQQSRWDDAIVKLSEGDHYLLVLIGLARSQSKKNNFKWLPTLSVERQRPAGDLFRLITMALAVTVAILATVVILTILRK